MVSLLNDVLDALDDLGYTGELSDEAALTSAVNDGARSPKFTTLISYLASELRLFYNIEENVNPTTCPKDSENFLFEISGFLSEYGCPYPALESGDLNNRLQNKEDCLSLLLFLSSELQAAKMYFHKNRSTAINNSQSHPASRNVIFDQLKRICITLQMNKPPDNISLEKFFSGIENKLIEVVRNAPSGCLSDPVIKQQVGPMHWEKLEAINAALTVEYATRQSMLLKRVDVTISSFNWSDRAKTKMNDIAAVYQKQRHSLVAKPTVTIAHLLASRDDLSQVHKTSSGNTRHACEINKVLMGNVPDRGGRTNEVAPPAPEMPSWEKRQDGGGRGGQSNYRGRGGNHYQSRGGGNWDSKGGRGGGGARGGHGDRPQSGRGGSRWGRGRGGQQGGGSFDKFFGHGGQGYGTDGFSSGRQVYTS